MSICNVAWCIGAAIFTSDFLASRGHLSVACVLMKNGEKEDRGSELTRTWDGRQEVGATRLGWTALWLEAGSRDTQFEHTATLTLDGIVKNK